MVAARVDNSQAGRIAAKGAIDAALQGLDQHDRGTFTLATSALNNQGGRLLSGGALTLRIAQALDNSLEGI
ncbi:hypothetical protein KIP72_28785, partial [Pseudomonas aeruginosa]|nr:hypothetical protein [Pseudomonas aeruginosa]